MRPFKTFGGAAERAQAERFFRPQWQFSVIANTNSHQVAQGYVWRIKKSKRVAGKNAHQEAGQ